MASEIERKFIVSDDVWRNLGKPKQISQGYLANNSIVEVRIRIIELSAYITIKNKRPGRERTEFEYQIPTTDAESILAALCLPFPIKKSRTEVYHEGHLWEVDEFHGRNKGLILAEVELSDSEERLAIPPWIGDEVTDDPRYRNAYLSEHPFDMWSE